MEHESFEVTLKDGSRALIRPILPEDKDRLQHGLRLLSPRSRYLRFHAPISELSPRQLRYLTEIDYRDHMAWVALDPDNPDEPGMGVARYVRLPAEPLIAEAAITVADAYQGRGVGTALLRVLADSAVAHGIRAFRSYVLAENAAMLHIFERLGARTALADDGVWSVELDLPVDAARKPGAVARQVLRSAARGELPSMPVIDPPWWLDRADVERRDPGRSRTGKSPRS